jgi:hypothetical protein
LTSSAAEVALAKLSSPGRREATDPQGGRAALAPAGA